MLLAAWRLGAVRAEAVTESHELRHPLLVLDVAADHLERRSTDGGDEPRRAPQTPQAAQRGELLAQQPGRPSLQLHEPGPRHRRGHLNEQVHMVGHHFHLDDLRPDLTGNLGEDLLQALLDPAGQYAAAYFGHQIRWYFVEYTVLFIDRYSTGPFWTAGTTTTSGA